MDKPEALQLADWLDGQYDKTGNCEAAADELRRLHAENDSLKRALAASCDEERDQIWEASPGGGCSRARSAEVVNAKLLAALKTAGLFLHHAWCDVQMNDYSFEKLNQTMTVVDAAITRAEE